MARIGANCGVGVKSCGIDQFSELAWDGVRDWAWAGKADNEQCVSAVIADFSRTVPFALWDLGPIAVRRSPLMDVLMLVPNGRSVAVDAEITGRKLRVAWQRSYRQILARTETAAARQIASA
jgi:hypothetical protein